MGWCLRFFLASITGELSQTDPEIFWSTFSGHTWQPIIFHGLSISVAAYLVLKGITKGIERTNKILIPALLIMIVLAAIRAVTLSGAAEGLNFFFAPDWNALLKYQVWLEALSQSAWSTGAGWGLLLTYAVYMHKKEDIVLNSFLAGLGNNSASLLVGISIFPAVFALAPSLGVNAKEVLMETGPASTGMAFIWMPRLFEQMPGGPIFTTIFFLSLTIAALTSVLAMIELAVRNLIDLGMRRGQSLLIVWIFSVLLGIPSARNMSFFENQDWVWGIGLIVSGSFFTFAINKYNPKRFINKLVNIEGNDIKLGQWFTIFIRFIIPIEFILLITWWFYQSIAIYEPSAWWHPFKSFSVGTCLFQWGIVIILFLLLNRWLVKKIHINSTR